MIIAITPKKSQDAEASGKNPSSTEAHNTKPKEQSKEDRDEGKLDTRPKIASTADTVHEIANDLAVTADDTTKVRLLKIAAHLATQQRMGSKNGLR